jgi:DNA mismatch repair protein MutL
LKLLVNGRPIRDRALSATVAHAFGPALEKGRYPRGVIYLNLPSRLVDINVHPQKTEVRFVDARAICDALYSVIARGLTSASSRPPPAHPTVPAVAPLAQVGRSGFRASAAVSIHSREAAPISGQRYSMPAENGVSTHDTLTGETQPQGSAARGLGKSGEPASLPDRSAPWGVDPRQQVVETMQQVLRQNERSSRALRFLGQAQDAYLVCAHGEGICVLDQHAADEIGIFLRLTQAYRAGGLQSQALLFPTTLTLGVRDVDVLNKRAALLLRLGLDVRSRAEGNVSLHGVMSVLRRVSPEQMIQQFLAAARGARDESTLAERFFSGLACKEAAPRGVTLGVGDAQAILKGLQAVDLEQGLVGCVHGLPLLSATSFAELSRKAQR